FGADRLHERRKVKALERRPPLIFVHLLLQAVADGDVREELADRPGVRRRSEAVLLFGNLFRNLDRVGANGAKTLGELFTAVTIHDASCVRSLILTSPCMIS